jgi:hypothetical protein
VTVESWELDAREQIRSLVGAYNALGDRGRIDEVMALFAADAVMDIDDGRLYESVDEIRLIFTGTRDSIRSEPGPGYVQHHTSSLAITLDGPQAATGHSYFTVMMNHGVDHWGRYQDKYACAGGIWLFASRRVRVDGCTSGGWAERRTKREGGGP